MAKILNELRIIVRRAADVWNLIPRQRKYALGAAALLMAVTSAGNTAVAVFLGRLVDGIQRGLEADWMADRMYWETGGILALIAGVYLVREGLHVYRRYLVQDSC